MITTLTGLLSCHASRVLTTPLTEQVLLLLLLLLLLDVAATGSWKATTLPQASGGSSTTLIWTVLLSNLPYLVCSSYRQLAGSGPASITTLTGLFSCHTCRVFTRLVMPGLPGATKQQQQQYMNSENGTYATWILLIASSGAW
jgi:hypothetical protein